MKFFVIEVEIDKYSTKCEIKTNGRALIIYNESLYSFFSLIIYLLYALDRDDDSRRRWPFLSSLPIRLIDHILLPYHIVFAYYPYY